MRFHELKNLRRSVIIVDDFFADPDAIVRYAQSLDYVFPYDSHLEWPNRQPVAWMSSRFRSTAQCPFKSSTDMVARLESITQSKIDRENWHLDYPVDARGYPVPGYEMVPVLNRSAWWNCTFHAKFHARQKSGEGVHDHSDRDGWNAVGNDGWVGLVYLSKDAPLENGLRTWRNRFSNHERFSEAGHWSQVDAFANVYNRLILHRGDLPHSGTPGWGSTLQDGRLFMTIFARTLPDVVLPQVKIRL